MNIFFLVLVCVFVSFEILAQVRQKNSHEHGAAKLMMVMDGEKLQIEFEVPSESLIGFEHFPKSLSYRENFEKAIKILYNPSQLFSIPIKAECLLVGLNVSQSLFPTEEEHGHDESEKAEMHSEFKSNYHWNCLQIDEIDSIGNKMMSYFPRIEEIRVIWIAKNSQGSLKLESNNDRIQGWK